MPKYRLKRTPEMLDRVVQVIWHYKQLHGEHTSPPTDVIANELGIHASGIGNYINKLENEGRLDRIQTRPIRVTLLDHPMNKRAVKLYQRELEKAHKPLDMQAPKPVASASDNRPPATDGDVIVVDTPPEVLRETAEKMSAAIAAPAPPTVRAGPPQSWADCEAIIKAYGGDLTSIATFYILNTARPGQLLEALLDRGYTVHKTNPKWKD